MSDWKIQPKSTSSINCTREMYKLIVCLLCVGTSMAVACDTNIDKCICQTISMSVDAHSNFVPIKSKAKANHILNVQFYVEGSKNWHISFSQSDEVNYQNGTSYEILAEWNGTRIIIARKRRILADVVVAAIPEVIRSNQIFPINIQMTKAGFIYLYCGNSLLMRTFDQKPLYMKYMSFSSVKSAHVKYHYDCYSPMSLLMLSPMPSSLTHASSSFALKKRTAESMNNLSNHSSYSIGGCYHLLLLLLHIITIIYSCFTYHRRFY